MFLSLEDISAVLLKWGNQYEIIKKCSTSAEKMIAAYQQQYHDCISKQPSMKKLPNKEWQVYHCLGCLRANFYFRHEKDVVCSLFLIRDKLRRRRSFQGGTENSPLVQRAIRSLPSEEKTKCVRFSYDFSENP